MQFRLQSRKTMVQALALPSCLAVKSTRPSTALEKRDTKVMGNSSVLLGSMRTMLADHRYSALQCNIVPIIQRVAKRVDPGVHIAAH